MQAVKIPFSYRMLVPLVVASVILALIMPRKGVFRYSWQKGGSWNYETLVAPFDFPILKSSDEVKAEIEMRSNAPFTSYFDYEDNVWEDVSRNVNSAFSDHPEFASPVLDFLKPRYEAGVLADTVRAQGRLSSARENSEVLYIQHGKDCRMVPYDNVYQLSELIGPLAAELKRNASGVDVDSLMNSVGLPGMLKPNLLFDRKLTENKYKEVSDPDNVSVTMGTFKEGDVIVRSGDAIRTYEDRLLVSFRSEFNDKVGYEGPVFLLWLGNFLLSFLLSFILYFVMLMVRPRTAQALNEYLFIIGMFLLAAGITSAVSRFNPSLLYMVPYPVFAIYLLSFFRRKAVMTLYIVFLLPLLIFCDSGMRMFVTFLFAGCVAVLVFSRFNKGWQQFVSAFCIFLSILFSNAAFSLVDGSYLEFEWMDLLYVMLGSLFVVLAYPLVYLFEKLFNLISESRLLDLTDTNTPALKDLARLTPGTFQHSIAVMNMVDAVGREVDADIPLLRAAALYHDIGKMENPDCYVENQLPGSSFHSNLSSKESAHYIIGHVKAGETFAKKYHLPDILTSFISTHHGTTSTGYFYNKYLNEGGDPADVADFFYPGPRPATKEQVVLMLCDSIDAASRTLSSFDYETVSAFVEKIYLGKMQAGQYDEADITLRELDMLKEALKQYLVHLHHGRIAYPERNNTNNNKL